MKKSFFAFTALVAAVVFWSATAAAQWAGPIVVGSSPDQVGAAAPSIKANAVNVQFFDHPRSAAGAANNFDMGEVTLPDATMRKVMDIVATPGLLGDPGIFSTALSDLLDTMLAEPTVTPSLDPAHGFCPKKIEVATTMGIFNLVFECQTFQLDINNPDRTDFQLEVADLRNEKMPGEFSALVGSSHVTPVVDAIGSGQDTVEPYDVAKKYPATIKATKNFAFMWGWDGSTNTKVAIDEPYSHVVAYPLAENEAVITAAYDPVDVATTAKLWVWETSGPLPAAPTTLTPSTSYDLLTGIGTTPVDLSDLGLGTINMDKLSYDMVSSHMSPLIFFRKDDATKRLRLSGYSSFFFKLDPATGWPNNRAVFEALFKTAIGFNSAPIDVEIVDDTAHDGKFLAVVNQATLGDVDRPYRDNKGYAMDLDTGTAGIQSKKWNELLYVNGAPIPLTGSSGEIYLPHGVVSYVSIWNKLHNLENTIASPYFDNPNEAYEPAKIALVGPDMFDSTVVTDRVGGPGTEKQYLVVASGFPDRTNSHIYIYKISPVTSPANKLEFDLSNFTGYSGRMEVGVAGEPYEVVPPDTFGPFGTPDQFVPYQIKAGEFDGDPKCGDLAMTWRAARIVWDPPAAAPTWFNNHFGDNVRFEMFPLLPVMFSDVVTIYFGQKTSVAGIEKCIYNETRKVELKGGSGGPGAKRQVAAIAVHDFGFDGYDDIIAGNLNPEGLMGGKATAFAYHYWADAAHPYDSSRLPDGVAPDERIRVGFSEVTTAVPGGDTGIYLVDEFRSNLPNSMAGVASLDVDTFGNIGAVIGYPLMLPGFGNCAKFINDPEDTSVESPVELWFSKLYSDATAAAVGWGPASPAGLRNLLPMRCQPEPTRPVAGLVPVERTPPGIPIWTPGGGPTPTPECEAGLLPSSHVNCCPDPCTMPALCCQICDPAAAAGLGVDPADFPVFCGRMSTCMPAGGCMSSELERPKDKLFAESPRGDGGGSDGNGTDFAEKIMGLFVKDAAANPASGIWAGGVPMKTMPVGIKSSNFRLHRGQLIPGDREITVVLPAAAPPPPGCDCDPLTPLPDCPGCGVTCDCDPLTPLPDCPDCGCDCDPLTPLPDCPGCGVTCDCDPLTPLPDCPGCPASGCDCDPATPLPDCPGCGGTTIITDCPDCCPPCCTPTCDTCERPDTTVVTMKCVGGSSDAAVKKTAEFNRLLRDAIGPAVGDNDLVCETEYGVMKVQVSVPGGGAPGYARPDLSLSTVSDLTGNIGQAALVQYSGVNPIDFTARAELPTKANMIPKATILLPSSAEVAAGATSRAMTLSSDLSASISAAAATQPLLSEAAPAGTDLVTSLEVLPENKFNFNNVIGWQLKSAEATKASTLTGVAVHNLDIRIQPLMCAYSAVCEGSEAFQDIHSYGKVDYEKVLRLARENSGMCSNGTCPAEFFKTIGLPQYQDYGFILVQAQVAKAGETAGAPIATNIGFAGGQWNVSQSGGGCGCNVTALAPNAQSLIAMLMLAFAVTGGFVAVRIFNFPSFVRRGKGR